MRHSAEDEDDEEYDEHDDESAAAAAAARGGACPAARSSLSDPFGLNRLRAPSPLARRKEGGTQ